MTAQIIPLGVRHASRVEPARVLDHPGDRRPAQGVADDPLAAVTALGWSLALAWPVVWMRLARAVMEEMDRG